MKHSRAIPLCHCFCLPAGWGHDSTAGLSWISLFGQWPKHLWVECLWVSHRCQWLGGSEVVLAPAMPLSAAQMARGVGRRRKEAGLCLWGHCPCSWHFLCLSRPLLPGRQRNIVQSTKAWSRQNWAHTSPLPYVRFCVLHPWIPLSLPSLILLMLSLVYPLFFPPSVLSSSCVGTTSLNSVGSEHFLEPDLPGVKFWTCHFLAVRPWISYLASCLTCLLLRGLEISVGPLATRPSQMDIQRCWSALPQLGSSASVSADPTSMPEHICWLRDIIAPGL